MADTARFMRITEIYIMKTLREMLSGTSLVMLAARTRCDFAVETKVD